VATLLMSGDFCKQLFSGNANEKRTCDKSQVLSNLEAGGIE